MNAYHSVGSEVDCLRWKNNNTDIKSLRQKLSEEIEKNENQISETNQINGKLANTQRLLRQFHVKKNNW